MARGFTAFGKAAGLGLVVQLMSPFILFAHEQREFKSLGFSTQGCAPLDQGISLEATIGPMHDGPGMDSAALRRYLAEEEVSRFFTYKILFHSNSLISSAGLYMAHVDGWDGFGM